MFLNCHTAEASLPKRSPMRRAGSGIARLARSRIAQFLAIGGLLFVAAPSPDLPYRIEISAPALASLASARVQVLGVSELTHEQFNELRAQAIEDEVLYREALRLGIDRSDPVVRQRLILKMLTLAEQLAGATRPASVEELRTHYQATQSRWARPSKVRFSHLFASEARKGERPALLTEALARDATLLARKPPLGEPFPFLRDVPLTSVEVLAVTYGLDFAQALGRAELGSWSGPIRSKFGWHLVKVIERRPASVPAFEEVRSLVALDHLWARKEQAVREYLTKAIARYRIEVGGQRIVGALPTRRAAPPPDESDPEDQAFAPNSARLGGVHGRRSPKG